MTPNPLKRVLMLGNEAIARGALEGGISYATGYPGNPSSEILETLFKWSDAHDVAVEWSVNEIVALEAAAAFAFSGRRAVVTMKQNGLNVAADFLTTVSLDELPGGLLVVVCDDPGPLTSSNEQDSRHFARIAQIPLLEPSTPQEAKDMAVYGLEISQRFGLPCMLRAVSRLSHGRGPVSLGPVASKGPQPRFDRDRPKVGLPFLVTRNHARLLRLREEIRAEFEASPWNGYTGPEGVSTLVVASGLSATYGLEAIQTLDLGDRVGLLKLGTTWPLPRERILERVGRADTVCFLEEVDPFVEEGVKVVCAENGDRAGRIRFLGKNDGFVAGPDGPGVGEMNTDTALSALGRLFDPAPVQGEPLPEDLLARARDLLVPRELSFCQGCPHRASFYALKTALELDGRDGFLVGDIGCYGMAAGTTGFQQIKALHCMGSGMGNACGFSRLKEFGFDQPVVAVAGDSTFFHAGLPALANAVHHNADAVFVILDNAVTAMTGFQVNPATPAAVSHGKRELRIENAARGLGAEAVVLDPVADVNAAVEAVLQAVETGGVHVLVFRHGCATFFQKRADRSARPRVWVDAETCLGDQCGCNRFCSRILSCPAILFDPETGVARIDEQVCTGCGLCVQVCPREAILLERSEDGNP
ncbi:MAG: 4Fe-4S binding protein [Deltaproteobacteria bacterium]|nr:4Fe-4S binding protein [Deltaproteobacteria bacterium]